MREGIVSVGRRMGVKVVPDSIELDLYVIEEET